MLGEVAGLEIVGSAANGAAALAAVEVCAPDVIVLDLRLPDVSGLELIPIFKARADAPRVVAITSHGEQVYRRECLERGADAFVDKTASFAELLAAITAESSDNH